MSLTESIDTTTPGGMLTFHVFGAIAQFERALIRERTTAGLVEARQRGRKGGRPPAMRPGDIAAARACNDKLQKLHVDLFCEPSPAPTKWALAQLGKIRAVSRLPIIELSANGQATVLAAMRDADLI